nr:MAG TPA: TssG, TssK, baseplate, complex, STRUCTURAL PROTEIN.3A [Bacteriophage sp.]
MRAFFDLLEHRFICLVEKKLSIYLQIVEK